MPSSNNQLLHCIHLSRKQTMKQYKFTIVVRSPMDVKDIIWSFTQKLKDVFPIVSIDFTEVKDVEDTKPDYTNIPERY